MYVMFHDVSKYITLRIWFRQARYERKHPKTGGLQVERGAMQLAEFRRYKDNGRYSYYASGKLVKENMTFDEMETHLKRADPRTEFTWDKFGFGINEKQMDDELHEYTVQVQVVSKCII